MPVAPCIRIRETLPAQVFEHRQPVAARESAARVDVERADADDRRRPARPAAAAAARHRCCATGFPTTAVKRSIGERQPGQPGHRLAVAQQAEQDRRHRRPGGVVERAVDRVEHPHQRRIDVGAAEFLAVHLDPGRRRQRLDHLPLDGQVDLGGEVVALLAAPPSRRGGRRRTARRRRRGSRRPRRPARRGRSRPAPSTATRHRGQRLRQRESPGVQRLSDDRALDAAVGQGGDGAQVVEAGHAAGGDHRRVGALGDARRAGRGWARSACRPW